MSAARATKLYEFPRPEAREEPQPRRTVCHVCEELAMHRCDFPRGGRFCDRPLCAEHTTRRPHPDPRKALDRTEDALYCPQHAAFVSPEGRLRL